ncbi:hypothetical protein ACIOEW_33180 [Streptomyces sp. NPDC087901]|uniref:hypothetical protein n=1 Tax=Streptomyces sp. NPDC087901 TaxID=3365818 RepID=UPI0038213B59
MSLHAARHALEPDLAPRAASAYRLSDGELLLLSPARVRIDSEEAGEAARAALASRDIPSLEAALTGCCRRTGTPTGPRSPGAACAN